MERRIEPTKVTGVYYSSTGTVYGPAISNVEGAEKAGAEVRLRNVRELAAEEAIASNRGWAAFVADAHNISAAAMGSPKRDPSARPPWFGAASTSQEGNQLIRKDECR